MTIKPTDATKLGLRHWVLSALLVNMECKLKHGKCRRSSSLGLGLGLCRWHECLTTIKFLNFSQFLWLTLVRGEEGGRMGVKVLAENNSC